MKGAEDYLKSSSNVDLVLSEDSRAKSQMKMSGVPYFVISSDNKQNETVSLSAAHAGHRAILAAFSHVMQ